MDVEYLEREVTLHTIINLTLGGMLLWLVMLVVVVLFVDGGSRKPAPKPGDVEK